MDQATADVVPERIVFADETGAALDWTATEEQMPLNEGGSFGGLRIHRKVPAQWLSDLRSREPEHVPISDADPIELVLTLDGYELDRWEGPRAEQVAALIALMRANDLPVVEAA